MPLDNIKPPRVSPLPVNDRIVVGERPTITFIRYLQDLKSSNTDYSKEINIIIDRVNELELLIIDLQDELDVTQVGAGLDTDGTYIPQVGTNYIDSSTSLANADTLLDTAIYDNTGQTIINITESSSLTAINQLIIADATSGNIDITLPNPTLVFNSGISRKIGITKKDTTSNIINILPFGSELIVGETSQSLEIDGEVLNFITDGTNWYLNN